ncbi:MAG: hypothetical protein K8S99_05770 [Planctomycetes bacterium]|nr:hypothetical protein [Planctomycetota bacterium]
MVLRCFRGCDHIGIRARHHEKVSVIGGLHAGRDPGEVGLLTHWKPNGNIDQHGVIGFLEGLLKEIAGPVIVVWDRPLENTDKTADFVARASSESCSTNAVNSKPKGALGGKGRQDEAHDASVIVNDVDESEAPQIP